MLAWEQLKQLQFDTEWIIHWVLLNSIQFWFIAMLVDFKEACQGVTTCTFECLTIRFLCCVKISLSNRAKEGMQRQISQDNIQKCEISGRVRADKVFGLTISCEACEWYNHYIYIYIKNLHLHLCLDLHLHFHLNNPYIFIHIYFFYMLFFHVHLHSYFIFKCYFYFYMF